MPKLYMTELAGRIAKLARDIVEDDFTDMGGARLKWIERFMISLSMSIAGGTSNIQRNIIAERSLGLPRDRVQGAGACISSSPKPSPPFSRRSRICFATPSPPCAS